MRLILLLIFFGITKTSKACYTCDNVSEPNVPDNMPWISALLVGGIAFIGTVIASYISKSTAIKGVENAKEIALRQIESEKEKSKFEFKATLRTENRQSWLNELRNNCAVFISLAQKLNIELQDPKPNLSVIKETHYKISEARNKILLLLNPTGTKKLHSDLYDAMYDFVNILDKHILNFKSWIQDFNNIEFQEKSDNIRDLARDLLYDEWQKIQMEENN